MGSKHLCSLVSKGQAKDDPKKFKKLVKPGKFYCERCGRVSARAKSVCKSQKL